MNHHLLHAAHPDQRNLSQQRQCKNHQQTKLHQKDLANHLEIPNPTRPVKGPPCIRNAEPATTAQDGRHHLTAKRAVEGHDRLVLLGQHRRRHTEEHRLGRDRDQVGENRRDHGHSPHLAQGRGGGRSRGSALDKLIPSSHPLGHQQGQEERTPDHDTLKRSDGGNLSPALEPGDPLIEALGRRLRDDDVHPRHLQVRQQNGQHGLANKLTKELVRVHRQDQEQHTPRDAVDQVHGKATESRPRTGPGAQVGDGGAQFARDGFRRAVHVFQRIGGFVGIVVRVQPDVEIGVGIFDGSESCDDGAIGVVDLHN